MYVYRYIYIYMSLMWMHQASVKPWNTLETIVLFVCYQEFVFHPLTPWSTRTLPVPVRYEAGPGTSPVQWEKYLETAVVHWLLLMPKSWECHHPNWRTHFFQRGRWLNHQPVVDSPSSTIINHSHIFQRGWNHQTVYVCQVGLWFFQTQEDPAKNVTRRRQDRLG